MPEEISLEPVHSTLLHGSARSSAPAAPAHEIDISNEWEDMIEVEPEAVLRLRTSSPAATRSWPKDPAAGAVEPEPCRQAEAPEADLSAQIADKVQEIRFYITQEMWEPAKAAILDLTEIAPDAPEVTELIAAVSAGQAKA